jgi:hypothetical protein
VSPPDTNEVAIVADHWPVMTRANHMVTQVRRRRSWDLHARRSRIADPAWKYRTLLTAKHAHLSIAQHSRRQQWSDQGLIVWSFDQFRTHGLGTPKVRRVTFQEKQIDKCEGVAGPILGDVVTVCFGSAAACVAPHRPPTRTQPSRLTRLPAPRFGAAPFWAVPCATVHDSR